MDKTPKYIKMCKEAKKIQKNFLKLGDYYAYLPEIGGEPILIWTNEKKIACTNERIPLPRQDQLQDMVEDIKDKSHRLFRFNNFLMGHYLPITHQSPYIYFMNLEDRTDIEEMLWLAFVMKEKFNKIWDNKKEEWILKP